MKVLQVTGLAGPGPVAGGVWQVARTQTEALRCMGHDVALVAGWLGPEPPAVVEGTALHAFRVRRPFPGAGLRALMGWRLARALNENVRAADVVHLHLCRDFATTLALGLARFHRKPVVAQSHGMLTVPDHRIKRAFDAVLLRPNLSRVAVHLALSDVEEHDLRAFGASQVAKLVNAVPDPMQRWAPGGGPRFAFLSRLHARKQPALFVQAALTILQAGVQASFVIAGPDQGEGQFVKDLVRTSGLSQHFDVLGPLDHQEVVAILAGGATLVLPSLDEPYPMVVLEAASLGAPIICTSESGVAPDLRRHDAALVVKPDLVEVAAAMQSVANDSVRRDAIAANARSLYEQMWSIDSLAHALERTYRDVLVGR